MIAALADENGGSAGDVDTHWCGRARCRCMARGSRLPMDCCLESSAPRGAGGPDGGERPSSPGRRSGWVKLEAVVPADRWGRREQPRQSWVGPGLPDGPGPVSETGRYTQGTGVVTPLQATPAPTRWMWAGMRCRSTRPCGEWGTPGLVCSRGPGGHGEGLRRSRGDAAGVEPGASPVDRTAVNVGTLHDRSCTHLPAGEVRRDRPDAS